MVMRALCSCKLYMCNKIPPYNGSFQAIGLTPICKATMMTDWDVQFGISINLIHINRLSSAWRRKKSSLPPSLPPSLRRSVHVPVLMRRRRFPFETANKRKV
jgi:hypothetical protein